MSQKYFLPSLQNQSCRDFEVVVAIHPQSPPEVEKFFSTFATVITNQISEFPLPDECITTRLDSDDMIHREFVGRVQAAAASAASPTLIDVDTAAFYEISETFQKITRRSNNSPFLSVFSRNPAIHCYSAAHTNMPKLIKNQIKIHMIGGLQVIHKNNIFTTKANGLRTILRLKDYK